MTGGMPEEMRGLVPEEDAGLPLPLSGETRLYLIVGDPVAQAGSPRLFNAAFRRRGARAVLFPAHVTAEGLPDFVAGLRRLQNLDGIVITIPHKIAFLGHVDDVEPNGRRVGAVNAVRCEADGRWVADNFDGEGCLHGLAAAGHAVTGRRVLLVGAGGAGRAIAHAVAARAPARLAVHDVDVARLDGLVKTVRASYPGIVVETAPPDPADSDIVVNATPLGMRPGDPCPVDPFRLRPGTLVVDVILKPPLSPLLRMAHARGCAIQPGHAMLAGQVEAIADFFGLATPEPTTP